MALIQIFPQLIKNDITSDKTADHKELTSTSNSPLNAVGIHYPLIRNEAQLTKSEVRDLAQFYRLFNEWRVNPHLRFQEGDISYWYEKGLSEKALNIEFDSMRIILERAEASGEIIDSQGDLSYKAQKIKARLLEH